MLIAILLNFDGLLLLLLMLYVFKYFRKMNAKLLCLTLKVCYLSLQFKLYIFLFLKAFFEGLIRFNHDFLLLNIVFAMLIELIVELLYTRVCTCHVLHSPGKLLDSLEKG